MEDALHYTDNDAKEFFFLTPLWNNRQPEDIGSLMAVKRSLYHTSTSYGEGKIIQNSLDPSTNSPVTIRFNINPNTQLKTIDGFSMRFEAHHELDIRVDLTEMEITIAHTGESPDSYNLLLSAAISAYTLAPDKELNSLEEETGVSVDRMLTHLSNTGEYLSFNEGFELELFFMEN